jgi:hypothetical protein
MRLANTPRLSWGLALLAVATLILAAGTVRGDGDELTPRGQIVIKPTGRRARPISASSSGATTAPVRAQVPVRPAVMSLEPTAAPRVYQASLERGLDFGEQSVRLPYAYDPRDNAFYRSGPFVHYPAFDGYSVTPWYGGYGYGYGYGYRTYGGLRYGHSRRHGAWSSWRR